jgi:hypothetical protein
VLFHKLFPLNTHPKSSYNVNKNDGTIEAIETESSAATIVSLAPQCTSILIIFMRRMFSNTPKFLNKIKLTMKLGIKIYQLMNTFMQVSALFAPGNHVIREEQISLNILLLARNTTRSIMRCWTCNANAKPSPLFSHHKPHSRKTCSTNKLRMGNSIYYSK